MKASFETYDKSSIQQIHNYLHDFNNILWLQTFCLCSSRPVNVFTQFRQKTGKLTKKEANIMVSCIVVAL